MAPAVSLRPRGRPRRIALGCGLWAIVVATSCRGGGERRAADELARSCAAACAALTGSGCDREGSRPSDQARCVEHCAKRGAEAEQAGCSRERAAYLGCAAGRRLDCSAACSAPLCLERGEGIAGCGAEHAALARCLAPCEGAGVVTLVDRDAGGPHVQAELIRAGCVACPRLDSRAPTGAPCQAASVCSQVCCSCPAGRARYLARVCEDGTCADAERACAAVRAAGAAPCAE